MRRRLPCFTLSLIAAAVLPVCGAESNVLKRPFAEKSGPTGATLFHRLASEQTGIVVENNYNDPRMWGERSRGFFYGPLGTGVALGDYDDDGKPDVFVVSKTEGHRLFRNLGDWTFSDVTELAGIAAVTPLEWEQGASWADVNNDGRLDLYVCRSGAANLLYINQGGGRFREEAAARGLAVNDDSVMAAFCDYDRDGWLDVYIVTNTLDVNEDPGRPDLLFHNNRDGTFRNVTSSAGIGSHPYQGHAAIWWDYNNDGWPDLYVANDFSPPDILYRNQGDGTFSNEGSRAFPHTTNSSMGADIGDLNNDGLIDLLATDMAPTTHEKDQRTMAESRAKLNDPFLDPFVVIQLPRNALFLNTDTEFLLEAAELAGIARTDWTWSVRCEDLDCDSRLDLHFTNGMNREQNNVDLTRKIAAADSLAEQTRLMKSSPVLAEANFAYRNLGDLRFEDVSADWGLNEVGVSFGAALGDLDGDGDLDLVYTNYQAGVTVLRNDAANGHRAVFHLRGTDSNRFGIGATVRIETTTGVQVRTLTLARGYMSSSEPAVHFGLGEADRITRVTVQWPSGREQVLTDLPVDHSYVVTESGDLVASSSPPGKRVQFNEVSRFAGLSFTAREEPFDEARTQPLLPRTFNRTGPGIAVGDLDGDETDDVIIAGTTQTPARALLADRQGLYVEASLLAHLGNPTTNDGPILIFDVNGDDRNDILITTGGVAAPAGSDAYQPRLLLNAGGGAFEGVADASLPTFHQPVGTAAAADFDRDGQVDVFLGARVLPGEYPLPPRSALWRNRAGNFEDVTDTVAPALRSLGLVTSSLWSDVDSDGWVDLLVALEWGHMRFFRNRAGKGFEDRSEQFGFAQAGTGLWTSLAAADFNGDGRPDYVVGNIGLNTPYRASKDQPILLYRGQFEESARPLTLEAYYEKDRILPRAARRELGAALPSVLRRFPQTNAYARATLPEILGVDQMQRAAKFAATQLQSGVFLSQADGTFAFSPLPRIAQIAPLQGMAAGDFDGDGFADIIAVQNAYTFSQTVGRFDGGLGQFLRGDGTGHFVPVSAAEGGLIVPGDARALALINFDGDSWLDFLVTRSRSASLAWQNRGGPGNRMLKVKLHGLAGNRNCIGASVRVELTNGTSQTSEVFAGGGVLAQNTSYLHFGYAPGNLPGTISIRWPTSRTSEFKLEEIPARLDLTDPSLRP